MHISQGISHFLHTSVWKCMRDFLISREISRLAGFGRDCRISRGLTWDFSRFWWTVGRETPTSTAKHNQACALKECDSNLFSNSSQLLRLVYTLPKWMWKVTENTSPIDTINWRRKIIYQAMIYTQYDMAHHQWEDIATSYWSLQNSEKNTVIVLNTIWYGLNKLNIVIVGGYISSIPITAIQWNKHSFSFEDNMIWPWLPHHSARIYKLLITA